MIVAWMRSGSICLRMSRRSCSGFCGLIGRPGPSLWSGSMSAIAGALEPKSAAVATVADKNARREVFSIHRIFPIDLRSVQPWQHGLQVGGDRPFQLIKGARLGRAIGPPTYELRRVAKPVALHI